jgi:hypothetical protein
VQVTSLEIVIIAEEVPWRKARCQIRHGCLRLHFLLWRLRLLLIVFRCLLLGLLLGGLLLVLEVRAGCWPWPVWP